MTDADLAARAAAGEVVAFGQLIERHADAARRLARAVLQHREDADDAAQDGFLSAWQALDRYNRSRPFGPWLLSIVVNAAHDVRRRRSVRATEAVSPYATTDATGPELSTERALLGHQLNAALLGLSERQRMAIVLFDVEGYSHREIGEILGIPEGTVRSDVFHARRELRRLLPALREGIR